MNGFSFEHLVRQLEQFPASVIEGPTVAGPRATVRFAQVGARAVHLAASLRASGLLRHEVLGLRSPNVIEWVIWDLAALLNGHVLHVFAEDGPSEPAVTLRERYGYRLMVDARARGDEGAGIVSLDDAQVLQLAPGAPVLATPADLYSMVYSSGSSGEPKGLLVSKAGTAYLINQFLADYDLDAEDRSLIFMTLSNFQQRMSMYAFLWCGTSFSLTTLDNAFTSANDFSPTYMVAPPSIYEEALARFPGQPGTPNSIRNGLGGHLRFVHTGMAPTSDSVMQRFAREGIAMYEAYGVTEAGMVAWNTPQASRLGAVGKPVNRAEVFLTDDGEIVVKRQFPLCLGYFEASEQDQLATFCDGQIPTGDIGEFDADGFLYLRGRRKNLITTRSGEKFLPEQVERGINAVDTFKWCVVVYDPACDTLYCYLVPTRYQPDAQHAQRVRSVVAERFRRPIAIQLIYTQLEPSVGQGTLTRNLKIRRGPLLAWLQASLAEHDARLCRFDFPAPPAAFIEHVPTLERIEGKRYVVIRGPHGEFAEHCRALQAQIREHVQAAGPQVADAALFAHTLHLTLAEFADAGDSARQRRAVQHWASNSAPLSLRTGAIQTLAYPTNLAYVALEPSAALRAAMADLRLTALQEGVPVRDEIAVAQWLFHLSLAHCPGMSEGQWEALVASLQGLALGPIDFTVGAVEFVEYQHGRELPAHVVALASGGPAQ
ncbi:AMP-binding protein [Pseudomonas sp. MAFF212428]|uniref:AMP-binding protein n=3 Tax=Pseudomonas brassicae TaxID=2708063 RepID=A0A6M0CT50_9PSED|nr:AMP-binding protein [Pseudomonas brassicae]